MKISIFILFILFLLLQKEIVSVIKCLSPIVQQSTIQKVLKIQKEMEYYSNLSESDKVKREIDKNKEKGKKQEKEKKTISEKLTLFLLNKLKDQIIETIKECQINKEKEKEEKEDCQDIDHIYNKIYPDESFHTEKTDEIFLFAFIKAIVEINETH